MKRRYWILALLGTACTEKPHNMTKETEAHKFLYAMGHIAAQKMAFLELSKEEADLYALGFQEGALHQPPQIDLASYRSRLQTFIENRSQVSSEETEKKGKAYLADFLAKGGMRTESGLGYKIEVPGNERKALPTSQVVVQYQGRFINGTVFDSTTDRNPPPTFLMQDVLPGWQEGLSMLGEGGHMTLVVPPHLAYGKGGLAGKVPPGATLVFDIYLLQVR